MAHELQIVQVLLDLAQLTSCENAYFVAGALWSVTLFDQIGNLFEGELHVLIALDEPRPRSVAVVVRTDSETVRCTSWSNPMFA